MARATRRSAAETREHVLAVAAELFYWQGIRATGVDTVAAEAKVAPTTLYRLFESKDDLVAAYVERADQRYRDWFRAVLADADPAPEARILAVFDALIVETVPELCRGCLFQLVLAEVPQADAAAHQRAVELKVWVREQFGVLTAALPAGSDDPEALADDLMLVMDGVYGSVAAMVERRPAERARRLVQRLLEGRQ